MEEMRDLDREAVIQRVWKRVMEGREEESMKQQNRLN